MKELGIIICDRWRRCTQATGDPRPTGEFRKEVPTVTRRTKKSCPPYSSSINLPSSTSLWTTDRSRPCA